MASERRSATPTEPRRYAHDAGGYVVAAQHPALGAIALQRDEAGRLIGASAEGMRALWRYADGDLAEYEMQAGDRHRTAQLTRDPSGRLARATIDGEGHEFGYDPAGQLVSARSPSGDSSFSYDASGRLAREQSPAGVVNYEYDAAGQLLARVTEGSLAGYEYDAAGRRLRATAPGSDRRYEWDDFGRLDRVTQRAADGDEPRSIRVSVDALGELAALDHTQMMWDSAHPLQPLAWDGDDAVIGEGTPWALAGGGAARWLAPDWQGSIGDSPRDPWGAIAGLAGPIATGARLGYRGELEFDGATWLRNRAYEPAIRSFSQPDALAPVPGTASAANPYHYAANNPVGLADPLGLRPVTDEELKKVRDGMDRNMFQKGGDWVVRNAGTISAVTGIAAFVLSFTPLAPLAPFLAGISAATGAISAYQSYKKGDYLGMALDIAGVALSGLAAFKALKDARTGAAMREADRGAATAISQARGATNANLHNYAARKYAEHADLVDRARELSRARQALRDSKQAIEYGGVPFNVISLGRSNAPYGTPLDPLLPPRAPVPADR